MIECFCDCGCGDVADVDFCERCMSECVPSAFVRSEFCTPWCGQSAVVDWVHTPACERAYAEAHGEDTYTFDGYTSRI